ncbi:hypothetical protein EDC01DRAFT_77722 [Geopyxis carbonaria]|nr:hypothetical protein EDC01DRAFT_77722 [Geopyxis carbonaria]
MPLRIPFQQTISGFVQAFGSGISSTFAKLKNSKYSDWAVKYLLYSSALERTCVLLGTTIGIVGVLYGLKSFKFQQQANRLALIAICHDVEYRKADPQCRKVRGLPLPNIIRRVNGPMSESLPMPVEASASLAYDFADYKKSMTDSYLQLLIISCGTFAVFSVLLLLLVVQRLERYHEISTAYYQKLASDNYELKETCAQLRFKIKKMAPIKIVDSRLTTSPARTDAHPLNSANTSRIVYKNDYSDYSVFIGRSGSSGFSLDSKSSNFEITHRPF